MHYIKSSITCTLILAMALPILSTAQKPSFVKSWAFVTHETRGTVMANDEGQPVDDGLKTTYMVYLETTTAKKPLVQKILVNGKAHEVSMTPIQEPIFEAGLRNSDETKVVLKPAKGHALWLLECSTIIPDFTVPNCYKKQLQKGKIILVSEVLGKKYYLPIAAPTELQPKLYM